MSNISAALDRMPLWFVFLLTLGFVAASIEAGFRLGWYRRQAHAGERDSPVGAIVAAVLGLLAFMLAFTFGLAASRFDARRLVLIEEANAIGTAYLRAGFLPQSTRAEVRRLLREYVDVRVEGVNSGKPEAAIRRSVQLHSALWQQAQTVAAEEPRSIPTGLFIESLNLLIDLHTKRVVFGLQSRIPLVLWGAIYILASMAMGSVGYQEGLSGSRRSLAVLALVFGFSIVMLLIADLDRPGEGMLRVSQQVMTDVRKTMQ
jgi:hypothetical protein